MTLELGGKSPVSSWTTPTWTWPWTAASWATFMHNGQACESGTRLFVPSSIYDEFMGQVIDRASRLRGALQRWRDRSGAADQRWSTEERWSSTSNWGRRRHARAVGARPDDEQNGFFLSPTIFTDVDNNMRIAQEEIFGPVLCVIEYDNLDDAIRMAREKHHLWPGRGVWSRDIERAVDVAHRIKAGTIGSTTPLDQCRGALRRLQTERHRPGTG
ncbi:MAG: aldehyde dehydrogenase family protein [Caldilineaceae bacterium]